MDPNGVTPPGPGGAAARVFNIFELAAQILLLVPKQDLVCNIQAVNRKLNTVIKTDPRIACKLFYRKTPAKQPIILVDLVDKVFDEFESEHEAAAVSSAGTCEPLRIHRFNSLIFAKPGDSVPSSPLTRRICKNSRLSVEIPARWIKKINASSPTTESTTMRTMYLTQPPVTRVWVCIISLREVVAKWIKVKGGIRFGNLVDLAKRSGQINYISICLEDSDTVYHVEHLVQDVQQAEQMRRRRSLPLLDEAHPIRNLPSNLPYDNLFTRRPTYMLQATPSLSNWVDIRGYLQWAAEHEDKGVMEAIEALRTQRGEME